MSDDSNQTSNENETPKPKLTKINAGSLSITVEELTEEEAKIRELESFNNRFEDTHIIQITAKNNRYISKVQMLLVTTFGQYVDGGWDTYFPESNLTLAKQLEKRREEGTIVPMRYFIGINSKQYPVEVVEKFRKSIIKLSLTN